MDPQPSRNSRLIVQKYGGTSVGTPERIRAVADRIAQARKAGHDLVVVVSAMGHTTDELIDLAHQVAREPQHREMDMLLTAGERISMALLSMALHERGVPALSFTGSQTGIITDTAHRRARIKRILGDRVRQAIATGHVAIVAGFQGVSETKEITTLGRGGSDTTAVALAAALGAAACEIYTDVNGVYSADPRVVSEAKLFRKIPHDLMVELATRGAGVLHPRSVELAKQFVVPLRVLNSLNQDEGTWVMERKNMGPNTAMEEFRVTGVTSDKGRMLLRVELERATVVTAIWDRATKAHLSMVAPFFADSKMAFYVERDAENEWRALLQDLAYQGFVRSYDLEAGLAPVSVVGDRFSQDGAALGEIMETLASSGISVTMGSASALALTVAVPTGRLDEAVKALHQKLIEGEKAK